MYLCAIGSHVDLIKRTVHGSSNDASLFCSALCTSFFVNQADFAFGFTAMVIFGNWGQFGCRPVSTCRPPWQVPDANFRTKAFRLRIVNCAFTTFNQQMSSQCLGWSSHVLFSAMVALPVEPRHTLGQCVNCLSAAIGSLCKTYDPWSKLRIYIHKVERRGR